MPDEDRVHYMEQKVGGAFWEMEWWNGNQSFWEACAGQLHTQRESSVFAK